MRIVGIDPGRHGALAHVDLDTMTVLDLVDMPLELNADEKTVPNARELFFMLRKWRPNLIIIEHVHARLGIGTRAAWTFAEGFGALLAAAQISCGSERRVTLVKPQTWKKALDLSENKQLSLDLARETFPGVADMLVRVKDHDRAEALLLTLYHRDHVMKRDEVEVF